MSRITFYILLSPQSSLYFGLSILYVSFRPFAAQLQGFFTSPPPLNKKGGVKVWWKNDWMFQQNTWQIIRRGLLLNLETQRGCFCRRDVFRRSRLCMCTCQNVSMASGVTSLTLNPTSKRLDEHWGQSKLVSFIICRSLVRFQTEALVNLNFSSISVDLYANFWVPP